MYVNGLCKMDDFKLCYYNKCTKIRSVGFINSPGFKNALSTL